YESNQRCDRDVKPSQTPETAIDRLKHREAIVEHCARAKVGNPGRLSPNLLKALDDCAEPYRRIHDHCVQKAERERFLYKLDKQARWIFLIREEMNARDDNLDKYQAEEYFLGEGLHDRHV